MDGLVDRTHTLHTVYLLNSDAIDPLLLTGLTDDRFSPAVIVPIILSHLLFMFHTHTVIHAQITAAGLGTFFDGISLTPTHSQVFDKDKNSVVLLALPASADS